HTVTPPFWTTCALVTMWPSAETITPLPPATWGIGSSEPSGPKKGAKPGGSIEPSAVGRAAARLSMRTTACVAMAATSPKRPSTASSSAVSSGRVTGPGGCWRTSAALPNPSSSAQALGSSRARAATTATTTTPQRERLVIGPPFDPVPEPRRSSMGCSDGCATDWERCLHGTLGDELHQIECAQDADEIVSVDGEHAMHLPLQHAPGGLVERRVRRHGDEVPRHDLLDRMLLE